MITIVPITVPVQPSRCPSCHAPEDIKEVCRGCGYEYPEPGLRWYHIAAVIAIGLVGIVGFLWACVTLMDWLFGYGNRSLVDIIAGQISWLASRRVW